MKALLVLAFAAAFSTACNHRPAGAEPPRAREPIVGLPCEGCEAVFEGLPESLGSTARIAPAGEPGEAMRIDGVVRDAAGRPVSGVIVYGYQTDARGIYPTDEIYRGRAAHRHGRLRGWVRTDDEGRYRFETIRPVGYPGTDLPAHVHFHVIEPGRCTYYIDDLMFEDDPRLTDAARRQLTSGRGGDGIMRPLRDASGTWLATRDIVLGDGVPGHPGRETAGGTQEDVEPSSSEATGRAERDRRVDDLAFPTTDVEKTKAVHAGVFGWTFTDAGPHSTSCDDGRLAGGFTLAERVTTGGPLVVVDAPDLERIEAAVRARGGRVVRETFEVPGGRRFPFADPSGNELAVWSDRRTSTAAAGLALASRPVRPWRTP